MALDKNDLKAIKEIVDEAVDSRVSKTETSLKDYVDTSNAKLELGLRDFVEFSIEKLEQRTDARFDKVDARFEEIDTRFEKMENELGDIIETNQRFLEILGDHDQRIVRVEAKLGLESV